MIVLSESEDLDLAARSPAGERFDVHGVLAPADHMAAVDVRGGQVGQGAAALRNPSVVSLVVWAPNLVGANDPDSSGQRLRTAGDTDPAVTQPPQDASRIWQSRARVTRKKVTRADALPCQSVLAAAA